MAVVHWVNHACFTLEHGDTRVICDPWLSGTAFDDGWAHLSESAHVAWPSITHIWFSHEHPDHFAPRDLLQIPERTRNEITVLYQRTKDRKVLDWCREKGFTTVEATDRPILLADGFEVSIRSWTGGDSYALFRIDDLRILNLNDCVVKHNDALRISSRLGTSSVDILLSQFSYADWNGNPDESETRRRSAEEKLQRLTDQIRILNPTQVIPFASFVWFCHEENRYMNDEAVTAERAASHISRAGASAAVLYPGDRWDLRESWRGTNAALARYAGDLAALETRQSYSSEPVPPEELLASGTAFVSTLLNQNGRLILRLMSVSKRLRSTSIWVTDHDQGYDLSLAGFVPSVSTRYDIALSSAALHFCFRHLFGGNTLHVNGRFEVPAGGEFHRFKRWMEISNRNNKGETVLSSLPRAVQRYMRRLLNDFATRIRRTN